jgi:hypothetical protein
VTASGGAAGPPPARDSLSRDELKQVVEAVERDLRPSPRPPPDVERLTWKDLASNATAILAVSGIVMYSILSLTLSRFYGALSVSPNDVGLGYANTLASSVGAVLMLVVVLILAAVAIFVIILPVMVVVTAIRAVRDANRVIDQLLRSGALSKESGAIDPAILVTTLAGGVRIGALVTIQRLLNVLRLSEVRRTTVRVTMWGRRGCGSLAHRVRPSAHRL